jgi:hypothetical protein
MLPRVRNAWALETALDVEWVHSIAPKANILNVTTNPAETLGVQGFPQMMDAEQFIVDTVRLVRRRVADPAFSP